MNGSKQAGEGVGLLIGKRVSNAQAAPEDEGQILVSFDGARPLCAGARDSWSTQGDNQTHRLKCPDRIERVSLARAVPRLRNGVSLEPEEVARPMRVEREVREPC